MRVLIVHAHHDPQSFNAAMTREATAALIAAGSEVIVSDLYAMNFDPVSDRRNFVTTKDPSRLRQQDEEAHAAEHNGFAPVLQTEMDKLAWCDTLIFQFPLWWFGAASHWEIAPFHGAPQSWHAQSELVTFLAQDQRPLESGVTLSVHCTGAIVNPSRGEGPLKCAASRNAERTASRFV
jgi:hypothetical protein